MFRRFVLVIMLILFYSLSFAGVHQVLLDNVTNSLNDTLLKAGNEHVFEIRLRNLQTDDHFNTSNGFRIYSNDGAVWNDSRGYWRNGFDGLFDQAFIGSFSADGYGADTVRFGTVTFDPTRGLPPGYDEVAFAIAIGPTNQSDHGKHICIDSSFAPPGAIWMWSSITSALEVAPEWSGPHCFTIIDCDQPGLTDEIKLACGGCIGTVGNVNCDPDQIVDFGDLTELIKYMFLRTVTLQCPLEANIDRDPDNLVDIGDITRLIDYLRISREPLGECVP